MEQKMLISLVAAFSGILLFLAPMCMSPPARQEFEMKSSGQEQDFKDHNIKISMAFQTLSIKWIFNI